MRYSKKAKKFEFYLLRLVLKENIHCRF